MEAARGLRGQQPRALQGAARPPRRPRLGIGCRVILPASSEAPAGPREQAPQQQGSGSLWPSQLVSGWLPWSSSPTPTQDTERVQQVRGRPA